MLTTDKSWRHAKIEARRKERQIFLRREDDVENKNHHVSRKNDATRSREGRVGTRARVYKLVECSRCTTAPKPPRTTAGLPPLLLLAVLRTPPRGQPSLRPPPRERRAVSQRKNGWKSCTVYDRTIIGLAARCQSLKGTFLILFTLVDAFTGKRERLFRKKWQRKGSIIDSSDIGNFTGVFFLLLSVFSVFVFCTFLFLEKLYWIAQFRYRWNMKLHHILCNFLLSYVFNVFVFFVSLFPSFFEKKNIGERRKRRNTSTLYLLIFEDQFHRRWYNTKLHHTSWDYERRIVKRAR